ncbi:sigma factor-like helix-turn-helix DNA-binding protein [Streptomyces sp. NPDC047860]|uniref:sigma factor-like helix-turn-helix DNA-binding protein n=1 Tax=Streptomyces sp. NPDC047860 TaxID=3155743 RepID=UPI0033CBFAC1
MPRKPAGPRPRDTELLNVLPTEVRNQVERVEALRAKNFTGPGYELLADELFRYAYVPLTAKLGSGEIAALAGDSATPLALSPEEFQTLRSSQADRDELAVRTIAAALHTFRRRALKERRWRPEENLGHGGRPASLETYFFGQCLLVFPREMRRWRAEREDRFARTANRLSPHYVRHRLGYETGSAPDGEVGALCDGVMMLLESAPARERAVVTLTLDGQSAGEIADLLQMTVPAVESVLYRFRRKARGWRRRGGLRLPSEMRAHALKTARMAAGDH